MLCTIHSLEIANEFCLREILSCALRCTLQIVLSPNTISLLVFGHKYLFGSVIKRYIRQSHIATIPSFQL